MNVKSKTSVKKVKELLERHGLQKYDICKICDVSGSTCDRWFRDGIPDAAYKLLALSLGEL